MKRLFWAPKQHILWVLKTRLNEPNSHPIDGKHVHALRDDSRNIVSIHCHFVYGNLAHGIVKDSNNIDKDVSEGQV